MLKKYGLESALIIPMDEKNSIIPEVENIEDLDSILCDFSQQLSSLRNNVIKYDSLGEMKDSLRSIFSISTRSTDRVCVIGTYKNLGLLSSLVVCFEYDFGDSELLQGTSDATGLKLYRYEHLMASASWMGGTGGGYEKRKFTVVGMAHFVPALIEGIGISYSMSVTAKGWFDKVSLIITTVDCE